MGRAIPSAPIGDQPLPPCGVRGVTSGSGLGRENHKLGMAARSQRPVAAGRHRCFGLSNLLSEYRIYINELTGCSRIRRSAPASDRFSYHHPSDRPPLCHPCRRLPRPLSHPPSNSCVSNTNGSPMASRPSGLSMAWKCKCGALLLPELPTRPIKVPALRRTPLRLRPECCRA